MSAQDTYVVSSRHILQSYYLKKKCVVNKNNSQSILGLIIFCRKMCIVILYKLILFSSSKCWWQYTEYGMYMEWYILRNRKYLYWYMVFVSVLIWYFCWTSISVNTDKISHKSASQIDYVCLIRCDMLIIQICISFFSFSALNNKHVYMSGNNGAINNFRRQCEMDKVGDCNSGGMNLWQSLLFLFSTSVM